MDPQFQRKFADVYNRSGLSPLPWFLSLGNHDALGNRTAQTHRTWVGMMPGGVPSQSPQWVLPPPGHYTLEVLLRSPNNTLCGMVRAAPQQLVTHMDHAPPRQRSPFLAGPEDADRRRKEVPLDDTGDAVHGDNGREDMIQCLFSPSLGQTPLSPIASCCGRGVGKTQPMSRDDCGCEAAPLLRIVVLDTTELDCVLNEAVPGRRLAQCDVYMPRGKDAQQRARQQTERQLVWLDRELGRQPTAQLSIVVGHVPIYSTMMCVMSRDQLLSVLVVCTDCCGGCSQCACECVLVACI